MEYDISHKNNNTTDYVQALKKLKFSVFWSKVEAALVKQFLENGSKSTETTERKEE